MTWNWLTGRRQFDVPCTVRIEHTNEYLQAHVELNGVEVHPGDQVRVHDAPTDIAFGQSVHCARRATVVRGGWLDRLGARLGAARHFEELYDLSFTPRRTL